MASWPGSLGKYFLYRVLRIGLAAEGRSTRLPAALNFIVPFNEIEINLDMTRGNIPPWLVELNLRRLVNQVILKCSRVRIVSYPRSGRTWLRLMLHDLSVDPRFTHAGAKRKLGRGPDTICSSIADYFGKRVLFLLRDPRDTVVSHFHHCVRQKYWDGDLPGFVRSPKTGFERLLVFNLGWLEANAHFKAFAALRYEDLKQDTEAELARVISFLACGLSGSEQISKAAAAQSFDHMKKREKSGELHLRFGNRFTASSEHDNQRIVRRGVIGGHMDELAPAEQEFCEELLTRYNYNLNIDRFIAEAAWPRNGQP
ncbi:MAG: sulfotransferase domain-containing protein [Akkermansiaceae bacterium]|nr:sulfotransferase domain-containing protein [Verrucomicrobiales bacterium]